MTKFNQIKLRLSSFCPVTKFYEIEEISTSTNSIEIFHKMQIFAPKSHKKELSDPDREAKMMGKKANYRYYLCVP